MDDNSERARHELLARLEEVLGPEEAATLMENLPSVPWSELATNKDLLVVKTDVAAVRTDVAGVKIDVEQLRADTEQGFADAQRGFAHLHETFELRFANQTSQREHFSELLTLRLATQQSQMEAFVRERVDSQTKLMVFSVLGALLTTAAIAIGAAAV